MTDTTPDAPAVPGYGLSPTTSSIVPPGAEQELLDAILGAVYPDWSSGAQIPHRTLLALLADPQPAPGLRETYDARQVIACHALDAVLPRLHQLWTDEENTRAVERVDLLRDGQHVTRDTLRTWAVAADQIAERAAGRRADAAHGARHLADLIRRELVHPHDLPAVSAALYEQADLFDRKRAVPAADDDTAEDTDRG